MQKMILSALTCLTMATLGAACNQPQKTETGETKSATQNEKETQAKESDTTASTDSKKDTKTASAKPTAKKGMPAPDDLLTPPADASVSGLKSRVLITGTGKVKPTADDTVVVHYSGWDLKGKNFDSSYKRKRPASFPLRGVIKGWTEGVQLMVEGEKRRFWIPADLAYGEKPKRPGAPAGDLVFDVELIYIDKPLPAPKDVAKAPSNAKTTPSGLKYIVLKEGSGAKPKASDKVKVNYSGWTKDGKNFDNSKKRGVPAEFGLDRVIPGWTEGVQLMSIGSSYRFWIPGDLAYGDTPSRPGAPAGTLVFDIDLLDILK